MPSICSPAIDYLEKKSDIGILARSAATLLGLRDIFLAENFGKTF